VMSPPATRRIRYFTKELLIEANEMALKTGRNRTLHTERLRDLPAGLRFSVGFTLMHGDYEMRVQIAIGPDENHLQMCWLDIPFELYNDLPEIEVPS